MYRPFLPYLLNIAYGIAIALALPWLVWCMIFRGKYREGYAHKLFGCVPRRTGEGVCIWLHAVSVGEVNLLRPLVAQLEKHRPDARLFISTTTKTGYELARQRFASHTVFYCPLDFTWAVRRAVRRIRPNLLLLAELELWPSLIVAAKRQGATVAIINGRLSERSFRGYRRVRRLMAHVLSHVDVIAAQDQTTADRFIQLGGRANAVHVTGSLKFDGAETDRRNPLTQHLRRLAGFAEDDIIFLAGSTQAPEESLAIEAYRELCKEFSRLRLVIVPRHPQRFDEVDGLLDESGLTWLRRSQLDATGSGVFFRGSVPPESAEESGAAKKDSRPLLLVDTVGELGAWWGTADIAFVGGSLSTRGGQNMIEPAAYAAAVCFGPNTRNFRDIIELLLAADAARVVRDGPELTHFVRRCLTDPAWAAALGKRGQDLVRSQLGATDRTLALLQSCLLAPRLTNTACRPAA